MAEKMDVKITRFLESAGDYAVTGFGGWTFAKVDPQINKIKFFNPAAVNTTTGKVNTSAKWKKALLYSGLGLAVEGITDIIGEDEDPIVLIGRYIGDYAKGLSAGTIAADPSPGEYVAPKAGPVYAAPSVRRAPSYSVIL